MQVFWWHFLRGQKRIAFLECSGGKSQVGTTCLQDYPRPCSAPVAGRAIPNMKLNPSYFHWLRTALTLYLFALLATTSKPRTLEPLLRFRLILPLLSTSTAKVRFRVPTISRVEVHLCNEFCPRPLGANLRKFDVGLRADIWYKSLSGRTLPEKQADKFRRSLWNSKANIFNPKKL